MVLMYDKKEDVLLNFGKNLTNIRKSRWELYKHHQNEYPNPFEKFSCCKSQDSLASTIGVERRTIGNWELGKAIPTLDKCVELCNVLECNIDNLLGAEELIGFSPSVIASHYSHISIDIINYGLENENYLTFLNFFMHPDNCSTLINSTALTAWKDFQSKKDIVEIYDPLKTIILNTFQQYQAFTPINSHNKETYKQYICSALPEHKITFTSHKADECLNIKSCISNLTFKKLNLSSKSQNNYEIFINYIVDYSFETLTAKVQLAVQKEILGKIFIQLLENYISQ